MKNNVREKLQYEITFETKCYENDWKYLLKTKHLDKMIRNCNFDFTFKHLIINNVQNPSEVRKYANKKVKNGIIDAYYFVDDYIDEALRMFGVDKQSFGKGYYYSSAELVGIYLCKTKYLLHFSSDAFMSSRKSHWIEKAIEIMDNDEKIIVANPTRDTLFDNVAKICNNQKIDSFFVGYYEFSDQCYLIRSKDFQSDIYNYAHPKSKRYPEYGGELFEKRVDSFIQTKQLVQIISSDENYIHRNFPKSKLLAPIVLLLLKTQLYFPLRNFKIWLQNILIK
ncbi:MAG: hypothetical protein M0Q54_11840 [Pigmentiphaga sp.]|nr:hypothetical protein [Pigmentiphaga sp.]